MRFYIYRIFNGEKMYLCHLDGDIMEYTDKQSAERFAKLKSKLLNKEFFVEGGDDAEENNITEK